MPVRGREAADAARSMPIKVVVAAARARAGADQSRVGRRSSSYGCQSRSWRSPLELVRVPIKVVTVAARRMRVPIKGRGVARGSRRGQIESWVVARDRGGKPTESWVVLRGSLELPPGEPGRSEGDREGSRPGAKYCVPQFRGLRPLRSRWSLPLYLRRIVVGGLDTYLRGGVLSRDGGIEKGSRSGSRVVAAGPRRVAAGGEVVHIRSAFGRRLGLGGGGGARNGDG
jgi:hypothetical protein